MMTGDISGIATCAFIVVSLIVWQFYRWFETIPLLRSWASSNGLRLTSKRMYLPGDRFSSPFAPMTMGWVWKYTRFAVRDRDGKIRKGWAHAHGVGLLILWDSGETREVNL
jgi:hypothetical protein